MEEMPRRTMNRYFNLSGKSTIEGTEIKLSTNAYLPLENGIPINTSTASYPNITAKKAFTLGLTDPDIDDCFIVSPWNHPSEPVLQQTALSDPPIFYTDTARTALRKIVKAYHPDTKIHLDILTTEPAFQFYTGKYIDVPEILDKDGKVVKEARGPRSGFCVEPSRFVNAVNVEEWRRQVVLKKGEKYGSRIVYEAWSEEEEGEPETTNPERIMKGVVDGVLPEGSEVW
jgi:aldose 1-epimerase